MSVTASLEDAPAAFITTTDTMGNPGRDIGTTGVVHCTAWTCSTTTSRHGSPPMNTAGGVRVASTNPSPDSTTLAPAAAMVGGTTDANDGRTNAATHASQRSACGGVDHVADALSCRELAVEAS